MSVVGWNEDWGGCGVRGGKAEDLSPTFFKLVFRCFANCERFLKIWVLHN